MVTLQAAMMAMLLSNPGQVELLDFYADWCGPCRAMQPTIQALEAKGYPVKKVNIDQNRELAAQYGIQSVPCYVMVVDGKEVERISGGTSFSRLEKMFKTAAVAPADSAEQQSARRGDFHSAAVSRRRSIRMPRRRRSSSRSAGSGNRQQRRRRTAISIAANAGQLSPTTTERDAQLIAASVRIRVEDPAGHSCGSGTIIDARGGKALILTCGHIFRDSKGKGKIEIELFGPHAGQKVEGRLESYDSETRDIGLVSIPMPEPLVAARLAPVGYDVRKGDAVASVGCDHGADPTVRRNQRQLRRFDQSLGRRPAHRRTQRRRLVLGRRLRDRRLQRLRSARSRGALRGLGADLRATRSSRLVVRLSIAARLGEIGRGGSADLLASGNVPAMPRKCPA